MTLEDMRFDFKHYYDDDNPGNGGRAELLVGSK